MMKQPQIEDRLLARQRPRSNSLLLMRWEQLLFLHWSWDPTEIQKTLPGGLFVDTFDGQAWLGIVPFFMRRVHPRGLPCIPWLSDFLELNVRTYVCNNSGRPGVWFYSLVCNQPFAVEFAKHCFHLNYVHGRMHAQVDQSAIWTYRARRRQMPEAQFRFATTSGPKRETQPGSLEFFLVERYFLFSADRRNRLYYGQVHHRPYRVGPAVVQEWSFHPAAAHGFSAPERGPDHVMAAEDLQVEAWAIIPDPNS
jgi:uncharacterized protein YqjF (DUF2071 family)